MKRYVSVVVTTIVLALAPMARTANGPDVTDTKMLAQPAVSADHVAFIYAADLWVADLDGTHVRRITGDLGRESSPAERRRRARSRKLPLSRVNIGGESQ